MFRGAVFSGHGVENNLVSSPTKPHTSEQIGQF